MDTTIQQAAETLPPDEQQAVARQLARLDALLATLEAGGAAPYLGVALCEAHEIVSRLYTDAATHPHGGRPSRWYLGMLGQLNTLAARHGLPVASRNWTLVP